MSERQSLPLLTSNPLFNDNDGSPPPPTPLIAVILWYIAMGGGGGIKKGIRRGKL